MGWYFYRPYLLPMILEKYYYADETYVNYEGHSFCLSNGITMPNGKIYLTIDSFRTLIITPTENQDLVDAHVHFNG
jgi:hypothetical protein